MGFGRNVAVMWEIPSIHFGKPVLLILLALIVPTVFWARKSLAGLGRWRGTWALIVRILILVLLVLSLSEAAWKFKRDDLSLIYVLDRSLSIPESARRMALEYITESQKKIRKNDTVGLVTFGQNAALERRPQKAELLKLQSVAPTNAKPETTTEAAPLQSVIYPNRTDIAAALRLSLAAFPSSSRKRIVLISDGNENAGTSFEEAQIARQNGVPIDVFPLRYKYENEVMVEKVIAPSGVSKGATFDVRTVVTSFKPGPAKLRLYENGGMVATEDVELRKGRNVFIVQRKLPDAGYYSYSAEVESADDTLYNNNRAGAFTVVRGHGKVLLVEGDPKHSTMLPKALTGQGLSVTKLDFGALPLTLGQIIPYDVLILSNISAAYLTEEGMRAVELAVKDWGVGLVMLGGENSFGAGGYQDSPVEKALPVSMDLKNRKVMPSGSLVIVLHTCEIPQGNYWARQIALAALNVLSSSDEFGIVYYAWQGGVKWLFPLQRVSDKLKMQNLINSVGPGDMPSFIPAMSKAHAALKASSTSIKHLVMISDGDPSYPSDNTILGMVKDGITITTIGINPHSLNDTKRLQYIASIGKGRYYEPQNSSQLPRIFIKEAATIRRTLIYEGKFATEVALDSELIKGIGVDDYPMLRGYVAATPKRLAEVPLLTGKRDPLLAHWQYGLGRAVAFTSDAKNRWAAPWLEWDRYEQFWAQVVRWSSRQVQDANVRVNSKITEDRAHIIIDAVDKQGKFINNIEFATTMVTPTNQQIPVRIEQTGPGRYEAVVKPDEAGTYFMSLRYTDEKGRPYLHTHGMSIPYSSEFRELKTNEEMLKALAEKTGGRVLTESDDVFARLFEPIPQIKDAWPLLLLIAVCLFPLDVFLRRVRIDYRALMARLSAVFDTLFATRSAKTATHVSPLLTTKRKSIDKIKTRTRRFTATEDVELDEPTLESADRPAAPKLDKTIKAPEPGQEPAISSEDDSYTGRLLRAKQKHKESEKDNKAED